MIYTKKMQAPGGTDCKGKYSLTKTGVMLESGKIEIDNGSVSCPPLNCKFSISNESFYRTHNLQCRSESYWLKNKLVSAGRYRKIGNISVITIPQKKGIIKYNLKVRKEPSMKAEILNWTYNDGTGQINYLDKSKPIVDEILIILGRTTAKTTFGKDLGYWYYVGIRSTEELFTESHYGWVYEPYVDLR